MMSENVNQIASAIAVAKEAFRPELVHVGEVGAEALQVLAWPAGMTVRSAEEFLAPLRPNPRARRNVQASEYRKFHRPCEPLQ